MAQAVLIHCSVKLNLLLSDDVPDKERDDLNKIIRKIVSFAFRRCFLIGELLVRRERSFLEEIG